MIETKLTGESKDIVSENINMIKEIFPEVITEDKIDFDKLKLILGNDIDDSSERYSFTWPGKTQAIKESQKQSTGTLRPCKEESKNWDTTQNLYIEGDNLEVLKLLQKSYYKKVNAIYIDPPYNTGTDRIYKDDYTMDNLTYLSNSYQIDNSVEGISKRLTTNLLTEGKYHSSWLNMIYPRLRLAKNLLSDEGIIFISIDDHEVLNLKKICDEIFGELNFISQIVIETANGVFGSRASQTKRTFVKVKEYVLVYAKNKNELSGDFKPLYMPTKELFDNHYSTMLDENLIPKSFNDYLKSDEKLVNIFNKYDLNVSINNISKLMSLDDEFNDIIINDLSKNIFQSVDFSNKLPDEILLKLNDGSVIEYNGFILYKTRNGKGKLRQYLSFYDSLQWTDEYIPKYRRSVAIGDLWKNFDFDMKNIDKEGNISFKDGKKPVRLIKQLFKWLNFKEGLVIDFFSGSATTADAVFRLNQEFNSDVRFILVQIPQPVETNLKEEYPTICEIGKERIRRAGDKIVEESGNKDLDIGFKVFKLDSSNLESWDPDYEDLEQTLLFAQDNIKSDRTQEDLIYEIMLKYGIDLTLPIEKHELSNNTIYSIGFGALLICLDDNITKDISNAIVELSKDSDITRVVFKDNGFASDSDKTNIKENLRTHNMAQLSSVIGSILRDIVSAQHEANLYSLSLGDSYGKDGKAKDFQLPNVMVSDMELDLKYGVKSASESQQQFNIKYDKFRQFLKELCEQVARVAISSAVTTVMTSDIERNEGEKHFFERLKKENKLHQEFCTFLSRNMRNSFRNNLYDAVDSSNGSVNNDVVISRLTDVVRKKFLYDTDLDDLFAGEDGEKLRDTAEKNIIKAMEAIVKKLSVDANFKSLHSFPQLDVAITADELMNMPEEAIHSFKIKFSPRNYSVSQTDDDSLLEDFVMR